MRRHLVLFARAPLLGTGKRRLAQDIGDIAALRFEWLMLVLLLRRLGADRRWQLRIAVTPDKACRHIRYRHGQFDTFGQGRGDLGARMLRALRACPPGPVVLVGADIPALCGRHIAAAFRLLGSRDLVFGPAEDGGFWLVGARHPRLLPPLFERVRWSGPQALADTLAGLPRRLTIGFAERLEDVDDGEAYRRLGTDFWVLGKCSGASSTVAGLACLTNGQLR
jgi:rSAM/selenodomain-associated transferase 1